MIMNKSNGSIEVYDAKLEKQTLNLIKLDAMCEALAKQNPDKSKKCKSVKRK